MKKAELRFKITAEAKAALQAAAERKGIAPHTLAQIILHEHFNQTEDGDGLTINIKNSREIVDYVEEKKLGNIEVFASFAMTQYMTRNSLTPLQKERIKAKYRN